MRVAEAVPTARPRKSSPARRPGRSAFSRCACRPRPAATANPMTRVTRPRQCPRAITTSNSGLSTASPQKRIANRTKLNPASRRVSAPKQRTYGAAPGRITILMPWIKSTMVATTMAVFMLFVPPRSRPWTSATPGLQADYADAPHADVNSKLSLQCPR